MQLTHSYRGNETKLVRNLFVKLTEFDPEFDDVFSRYFVVMRWSEVTDDARTYKAFQPHSTYSERYSSTSQESGGPLWVGKSVVVLCSERVYLKLISVANRPIFLNA